VRSSSSCRCAFWLATAAALGVAHVSAAGPPEDSVLPGLEAALAQLEEDGDLVAATIAADNLFDQAILYGDLRDTDLLREAAFTRRLVALVAEAGPAGRESLGFLRRHDDLARELVFMARPPQDDPAEVMQLLDRLRLARGERLNEHPSLVAAICVVHDRPLRRHINENLAQAPDALAIFDYFTANADRMLFGLREVPAELLVYVVDATSSIEEMQWAVDKFAGDTNVGARFFQIEYDQNHLRTGAPKKVTLAGWNLPNILEHGGVCADQAYFASTVGKAIGVPTTYTVGASAEVAHAWVGFLQSNGRRAWWNFDAGRYEAYQGVRGVVRDPQSREMVPDNRIALLADFVSVPVDRRRAAAALTDAARRLRELSDHDDWVEVAAPAGLEEAPRRGTGTAEQLAMLEAAAEACPGYADAWFTVEQLAADGQLTLADKKAWAKRLHRLCGRRYPDFELAVLDPMIRTVDDPQEQNRLWNAAFESFARRADLAAAVRMAQAELWLGQGEPAKAGQCYEDVILRFANSGPFILEALRRAEGLLQDHGDSRRILMLYERAWSGIRRPKDMAGIFVRQSNWYRVGDLYARHLQQAGLPDQAAAVRRTIGGRPAGGRDPGD
jgi:hypothetical protein